MLRKRSRKIFKMQAISEVAHTQKKTVRSLVLTPYYCIRISTTLKLRVSAVERREANNIGTCKKEACT